MSSPIPLTDQSVSGGWYIGTLARWTAVIHKKVALGLSSVHLAGRRPTPRSLGSLFTSEAHRHQLKNLSEKSSRFFDRFSTLLTRDKVQNLMTKLDISLHSV